MAWVNTPGLVAPIRPLSWPLGSRPSSTAMNNEDHRLALAGLVYVPGGGSKTIDSVTFIWATVNKAGGSGLEISLQDINLSSTGRMIPDGTPDETVAVANGDTGWVSNATYTTGSFSSGRVVAHGEPLAIVIDWDGSGRLGSDSTQLKGAATLSQGQTPTNSVLHYNGSTWSHTSPQPEVLIHFTDGSIGHFMDVLTLPTSSGGNGVIQEGYHTGTNPDERGGIFELPFKARIGGIWVNMYVNTISSAEVDVKVYEGATTLLTNSVSGRFFNNSSSVGNCAIRFSSAVEIEANTPFRITVMPTTATAIQVGVLEVGHVDHWQAVPDFAFCQQYTARNDAGAWSETATKKPYMGLFIDAIDTAGGGGGGVLIPAGVIGG